MLLRHAEGLFAFAERCPGDWIKDGREGGREGRREGGREGRREGGKDGEREGGSCEGGDEGWREMQV